MQADVENRGNIGAKKKKKINEIKGNEGQSVGWLVRRGKSVMVGRQEVGTVQGSGEQMKAFSAQADWGG